MHSVKEQILMLHSVKKQILEVTVSGADFWDAQCQGVYFGCAYCQEAVFYEAQCQGADFNYAWCQGAYFIEAQCQGADFNHAQFQGAHFHRAHFQGVNFSETHFQGTGFNLTQCQGAYFDKAQCQGADFYKTQCQGAYTGDGYIEFKDRIGKKTELKTMQFAGELDPRAIKKIEAAKNYLGAAWYQRMQKIIEENKGKEADEDTIPEGIITDELEDNAENRAIAEKNWEELERINKDKKEKLKNELIKRKKRN